MTPFSVITIILSIAALVAAVIPESAEKPEAKPRQEVRR